MDGRMLRAGAASLALSLLVVGGVGGQEPQGGSPGRETPEVGRIVGRILDGETGRPLANAQVYLADGTVGTLSSVDGRYLLRGVSAGIHGLRVTLLGYAPERIPEVRVLEGATTTVDVVLRPRAVAVEGITVTAAAERGSTSFLLAERARAAVVTDAVGREEIARSPDGDAAAALRRVPGLTVVDGSFAHIRGLGERYTAATLDGAPLASPVPDRRAVPLDLFPTSLLESIVAVKGYSPDMPGDQAGGLVDLRTRRFPPNRLIRVSLKGNWNSVSTFREGLGGGDGGLDLLGFPDGSRGLPQLVPRDRPVLRQLFTGEELMAMGRSFRGAWGPTPRTLPPGAGMTVALGDEIDVAGDGRLGFVATATWKSDHTTRRDLVERVLARGGGEEPEVDYRGDLSVHSVTLGGLLNVTFEPRRTDRISLSTVYNRSAEERSRILTGFNLDSNTNQWNSRLRYVAASILSSRLSGEHLLGGSGRGRVEWRVSHSRAGRDEPGTREVLYREADGRFVWDDFVQSGSVFHQELVDEGWGGRLALTLPIPLRALPGSIGIGGSWNRRDRTTYTRRLRFRPVPGGEITSEVRALEPNELFAPAHISPRGFELQEATFRTDNYDAAERIRAVYLKVDAELRSRVGISGGVRVEQATQRVGPRDLWETGLDALPGAELSTTDVLPALNVTVALGRGAKLRVDASRTLARPQLRELAPFSFADYAGGYLVAGNPELGRAGIRSLDVRLEWFPDPRSVVSVGGFRKSFADPIEVVVLPSSEPLKTWVNAEDAEVHGVELELRTPLERLHPALGNLAVDANLTLVHSSVRTAGSVRVFTPGLGAADVAVVERDRALQGQSPYVVNLGLTWASPRTGGGASLLFNRFGRRIDAVGGQATPDIYEEARGEVDLVLQQPLRGGWRIRLAASRLLGGRVRFTQGGETVRSYDRGRTLSLSVSWGEGG